MTELQGRVAVVTGAARNIGRAIALDLARGGARVVINAKASVDLVAETAALIRAEGGEAAIVMADITSPEGAGQLFTGALAAFGQVDIVVNNAALRRETAFAELGFAEWREVMGVIP